MSYSSEKKSASRDHKWGREFERAEGEEAMKRAVQGDANRTREINEWQQDSKIAVEKWRTLRFHVGGSLVSLSKEDACNYFDGATGTRGEITGFSDKSRKRMMEAGAKLLNKALPVFLTVTWGAEWPEDPREWKTALTMLWKRIKREWPEAAAIWKLEPQKRGAPHFHLMLYGVARLPWQWLAVAWAEVIHRVELPADYPVAPGKLGAEMFRDWIDTLAQDDSVLDSLRAGTQAKAIESNNGVKSYMGKNYMGKEVLLPATWKKCGRIWGMLGRAALPNAPVVEWQLSKPAAFKMRRLITRWMGRKNRSGYMHLGRMAVFTSAMLDWARAALWATGDDYPPRHIGVDLCDTPF